MKVYIIQSGCIYEGGGVDAVFSTLEKADEVAIKMCEKKVASYIDLWTEKTKKNEHNQWHLDDAGYVKQEEPDCDIFYVVNKHDYVMVKEMEVQ